MPPPAYELRARYVASMRASYSPIVLWRTLRITLVCLELLRRTLDIEIARLQRRISFYWHRPRVTNFLQHIQQVLDRVANECRHVMSGLVYCRLNSRLINVEILKKAPWFLAYQRFFEGVLCKVFIEEQLSFFQYKRPWVLEGMQIRRFSTGARGVIELGDSLHQRWGVEMKISQWLRDVQAVFTKDLSQLRSQYNSGDMFKALGEQIFEENQRERTLYKQQNVPWRYENYNFQMRAVDMRGKLLEILRCEEDWELRSFVQI